MPKLLWFLIAYWLFIDSILTVQENLPIYLERVFGFSDQHKAFMAVSVIVMATAGAILTAFWVKPQRTSKSLMAALIAGAICLVSAAASPNQAIFISFLLGSSLVFGAIWTLSRAIYTSVTPPDKRAEYFGFYSIAEKSASLVGPLVWGSTVSLLTSAGIWKYKAALAAMGLIMMFAILPLLRTKQKQS